MANKSFYYRGLKVRPSVRGPAALDIWDPKRGKWFYTSLSSDKKVLAYYLYEREGEWVTTWDVHLWDLVTLQSAGKIRFTK